MNNPVIVDSMSKKQTLFFLLFLVFFLTDLVLNTWPPLSSAFAVNALSAAKLLATLGWFISLVSCLRVTPRKV